jgi:hypothetical protein
MYLSQIGTLLILDKNLVRAKIKNLTNLRCFVWFINYKIGEWYNNLGSFLKWFLGN